ncbi:MAG: hypothetical protein WDM85_10440 [Caulobacteraceae bacterium]
MKWQVTDTWSLDNKAYTDSFLHSYTESKDATDTNPADNKVSFFNAAGASITPPAGASKTDVPGKTDLGLLPRLWRHPAGQRRAAVRRVSRRGCGWIATTTSAIPTSPT